MFFTSRSGSLQASRRAAATSEPTSGILPNVSAFEKSGTLVNAQGRVQKLNQALMPQFTSRDLHAVVFGVERGTDRDSLPPKRPQSVFESMLGDRISGAKIRWRGFDPMGVMWQEGSRA